MIDRARARGRALTTLFRTEIRMLLRDRRTLLVSVVVPLAIWPLLFLVMSWTDAREQRALEASTLRYSVAGSREQWGRELVHAAISRARERPSSGAGGAEFEESDPDQAIAALRDGEIQLVVQALAYEEASRADGSEIDETAGDLRVPVLRLLYQDTSGRSSTAMMRMWDALEALREERRGELFRARGLPVALDQVAAVESRNVAPAEREAGTIVGIVITPLIVMLMLTGGSIVAVDALTGEKERGTLETLLTTAARRWEIVVAKQLAIVVVGLAIAFINVANLLVYLALGLFEVPEALARLSVTPLSASLLFLMFLPLALLISSVLLLISGYAKSYKEFQIYFFPLFLLLLIPSAASILPSIELRSIVSMVPVAGVSVAAREILAGQFDWTFLAICFASTGVVAVWMARQTIVTLSTEKLITSAELDRADLEGGPALFPRHVLRWYAVMWVTLLIASNWFGAQLGPFGQVVMNLVGIFGGFSALMLWRYRLPVREALALRRVSPAVWLAVLIGAPAGFLTGQAVFRLANLVLPVPNEVLEAFGQFLTPEDLPVWQVFFFLCVLPGVIEEIAFRGLLLHGLRRRLGPIALCLAVGGIFGLFHVSLFRLVPTAYIGIMLAAVVLLTGSILPAMVWHILNNATALIPSVLGWFPEDMVLPWWWSLIGVVGLALSFGLLWMNRNVYPGLRGSRR